MQKDKFPAQAAHHSSGGRKVPVSGAERAAAAREAAPRRDALQHEVMRTRADAEAEATKDKRRSH